MSKSKEQKKIPTKNYIILVILFLATFLLAYYIYKWYDVYSKYQNEIPVIRDSLNEVTEEEMDHYVRENQTSAVYICTSFDTKCRNFEKNFKKLVDQESLKEYILYVGIKEENQDHFIDHFNDVYSVKKKIHNYPAIVILEDGKISDVLEHSKEEKVTISEVKKFLKRNEIGSKYQG